jgi:hypothetical protein
MKKLLILSLLILIFCNKKQDIEPKNSKLILGNWYRNKWEMCHTLKISKDTIFVDNAIDSVSLSKYEISNDSVIIWDSNNKKHGSKILKITKDTLILDGLGCFHEKLNYSRINKNFGIKKRK